MEVVIVVILSIVIIYVFRWGSLPSLFVHRSPESGASDFDQMGKTAWQAESLDFELMQLMIENFGLVMEVDVFHAREDE